MSDRAAALTYYAALSIFPGAIVLVSLLKVFGDQGTVTQLLKGIDAIAAGGVSQTLQSSIEHLVHDDQGAGIALVIGLVAAVWTASAYVGGLLRAHRRIAHVGEPGSWWRERVLQLGLTVALIVAMALSLTAILASGRLAEGAGAIIGLGDAAVDVWRVAKWPALLLVGVAMAGLIRQVAMGELSIRGIVSWGGCLAAFLWVAASAAFAVYVAEFGRFDQTYRSLTAVIVFLIWLWISNAAFLFGAELDAEVTSHARRRPAAASGPE